MGSALISVDFDVTIASDDGVDTVAVEIVLEVMEVAESRGVGVGLTDLTSAIISRALNFVLVVVVAVVEKVDIGTRGLRGGALAT